MRKDHAVASESRFGFRKIGARYLNAVHASCPVLIEVQPSFRRRPAWRRDGRALVPEHRTGLGDVLLLESGLIEGVWWIRPEQKNKTLKKTSPAGSVLAN